MGSNEKCPGAPHTPMDINRETVVQLYFQSSLSRERRFHDDQPVKLLHPAISIFPRFFPPVFAGTSGGEKAEGREKKNKRRAAWGRDGASGISSLVEILFPLSRLCSWDKN